MLIRALVQINGSLGTFPVGVTADIEEVVAVAWIEAGIAERVTVTAPAPVEEPPAGPIEEAVVSPPETATVPRRRGRR